MLCCGAGMMLPGMGDFGGLAALPQQPQQPVLGGMGLPQQSPMAGLGGMLPGAGPALAAAPAAAPMSAQPPKKKDPFADLLG
jgi:hypothetical protein